MNRLVNRQRQCRRELREAWLSARGLADSVTHWQCKKSWMGFYLIRAVVSYLFQLTGTLSVYGFRPVMQFSGYFYYLAVHVRTGVEKLIRVYRGVGAYWSSSASTTTNAWYLLFNGSNANLNSNNRADGYSVRCVAQNLRLSLRCSFVDVKAKVCTYLRGIGCYWSSSASTVTHAWFLNFNGSNANLNPGNRADSFSVRCVAQNLRLSLRCSLLNAKPDACHCLRGFGYYWSSSASSATAAWLLGIEGESYGYLAGGYRIIGFSVRCVAQHLRLSLRCSFLDVKAKVYRFMRGFGYYWSSQASRVAHAWSLYFTGSVAFLSSSYRTQGFPVRCVAQHLRLSLLCSLLNVRTKVYRYVKGIGLYWSSSVSDAANAWFLDFNGSFARLTSGGRAQGFSVRCVAQHLRLSLLCSLLNVRTKVCRYWEGIGYYWSSSASHVATAWSLDFDESCAYLYHGDARARGFSVRCVAQYLRLSLRCSFLCVKNNVYRYLRGFGYYWSSWTYYPTYAWGMEFSGYIVRLSGFVRSHGFSVRCVAQYLQLFGRCSFLEIWFDRFSSVGAGRFCLQAAGARN